VTSVAGKSTALVTASYAPDFERCRLLCDTVEEFVTGIDRHYILVAPNDVALFRTLQTAKRIVVDEREILPAWLRSFADPTSLFRRRLWISARTAPLRGWHVQQLRRIGVAALATEATLAYCDSDVLFLKGFDAARFWRDGRLRLFRRDDAISPSNAGEHPTWSRNAGRALGIEAPAVSPHDYIATLIAWRRETVEAMCRRIEAVSGRHWVEAIASDRRFSECMLYGRFVDEIDGVAEHFHDDQDFCRVHWTGTPMSDADIRKFVAGMAPEQVAIGMQSFIGTDVGRIRRLLAA
jgi:hypothetical protein